VHLSVKFGFFYYHTVSLFPCARAGPILTSLWAGCKINIISRGVCYMYVATPQIV